MKYLGQGLVTVNTRQVLACDKTNTSLEASGGQGVGILRLLLFFSNHGAKHSTCFKTRIQLMKMFYCKYGKLSYKPHANHQNFIK